jgi:hypothetical protein
MIVGKSTKQPAEINSYSVIYDDDLNPDEEVTTAYHLIFNEKKLVAKFDKDDDYTALAADVFSAFRVTGASTFTLPTGLADGSEFYVANYNTVDPVTIASSETIDGASTYSLPVNHSVVIQRQGGLWVTLVNGVNIVVNAANDHRVRVFFDGGADKSIYIIEVTADTNDGRRLQDELRITVKEIN